MGRAGIFGSARVAGGGGITATFQQSAVDATDLTTYTFTSQPIGSASATRRVVVAVVWRGPSGSTAALSSATIGGVSATIDVAATATANTAAIISAVVPTGTTASVVLTFAATQGRCGIGVWTLSSGSPTGQVASAIGNPVALTVTTAVGDVVIAAAGDNPASTTFAWTNATERYDQAVEGTGFYHSGADTTAVGTSTAISVTTGASTARGAAAAYA